MNYLEFKRQLMVDPHSTDIGFTAASNADERNREAYQEAMRFESSLTAALAIPVPDDLINACMSKLFAGDSEYAGKAAPQQSFPEPPQRRWNWLPAMAAGLMMGVGLTAGVFLYQQFAEQNLPAYLDTHWQYDGPEVISRAALEPMSPENIQRILATLDLSMDYEYAGSFMFAKNCPTPSGVGVHMVMNTEYGPVTVIYIPGHEGKRSAAKSFRVDGMLANLVTMQQGSVAILGNNQRVVTHTRELVNLALRERAELDV